MLAPPNLTDVENKEDIETPEPLQEEEISLVDPQYGVRHMVRGINAANQFGADGSKPLPVIEDELNSMLLQGYKLFYVQHLRSNYTPEGNTVMSEQMLYVFLKENV